VLGEAVDRRAAAKHVNGAVKAADQSGVVVVVGLPLVWATMLSG
jgi:hypothetical protein